MGAQVDRFMVAQAIMLAVVGVPGIYFHSLFGSRGWPEGVQSTGRFRTINRQKLERDTLERELDRPDSLRHLVFKRYAELLKARAASPAFDPYGEQNTLDCGDTIFALMRRSSKKDEQVLCLHNVSDRAQSVSLPEVGERLTDLLSGQLWERRQSIQLAPYQVCWLRCE